MVRMKVLFGQTFLAVAGWILGAGSVLAQSSAPAFSTSNAGGFTPSFGYIYYNFGSTGVGSEGTLGRPPRLSLGSSGGGGGKDGTFLHYTAPVGPSGPVIDVASLRVLLPTRDAQLWVNDSLTTKQGTERKFLSPFLRPDRDFVYAFKVRYKDHQGRPVELSRTITVRAGSQELVDFTGSEGSRQSVARQGQNSAPRPDRQKADRP